MRELSEFRLTLLLEAVADIAYLAGAARYHSGDSREDVQKFISWAEEFEKARKFEDGVESYFGENYMTAIEVFTNNKLNEAKTNS